MFANLHHIWEFVALLTSSCGFVCVAFMNFHLCERFLVCLVFCEEEKCEYFFILFKENL